MSVDYLVSFVEQLTAPLTLEPTGAPEEPAYLAGYQRGVKVIDAPQQVQADALTLEEARAIIWHEMTEYAKLVNPEHMLLIKAQPGVGKTHAAVRLAELLVEQGRRVLYCAPRHDFIHDLRAIAGEPQSIYEWLPRQTESETKPETCRHTEQINIWLHRGYDSMDFCSRVCGWEYANKSCPFHAQKRRREPIIMGQHQHLTSGHPLDFAFIIGDESPLTTFQFQWLIPHRWILPRDMDLTDPLAEILHEIAKLAEQKMAIEGPALIRALGGAEHVIHACAGFSMPATAVALAPMLHNASDAETAPYFHLPHLVPLLLREAEAAADDREYPHRVIIEGGNLMLLLRRDVSSSMPPHVVWLDATGNEHLYREIFRRPVRVIEPFVQMRGRIIQVSDRANGKSTLVKDGAGTDKATQLIDQVTQIVQANGLQRPGIVSFQEISARPDLSNLQALHFYAARGTNVQQDVDGHIVAGTPQPSLFELDKLARIIFFNRMTPFNRAWSIRDVPYNHVASDGTGRAYSTSGFWHDADLQAVLWQHREAELIQAVHRSRLTVRDVTVWLLSNLPVWQLPPASLISVREIFEAPAGVDAYLWPQVLELATARCAAAGVVTSVDLVQALNLDVRTARKYIDLLAGLPHWEPAAVQAGRGRPPRAVRREE